MATLLLACGRNGENAHPDNRPFSEALAALGIELPTGAKFLMLIPLEGCSKCTEACISFSKQYLNNPNIVFVAVSGMGMREARRRYSTAEQKANNLILDGKGFFLRGGIIKGEVTLLHLANSIVVDKEIFRPDMVQGRLTSLAQSLK